MYQRAIVINVMWTALLVAAWQFGLVTPFISNGSIELALLSLIGIMFAFGQGALLCGFIDAADRIAQMLPKVGLVCFGTAILAIAVHADLGTALGKSAFARSILLSISLNVSAIIGMIWLESLVWSAEGLKDATE